MQTLAVFGGSKELPKDKANELNIFLTFLLSQVRGKVNRIVYGGGHTGVMGQVFNACGTYNMPIVGYTLEKYKRPTDLPGTQYFGSHLEQVDAFVQDSDAFLALPGGFGTIREILHVNESLKAMKQEKPIYVPSIFGGFHTMIDDLIKDGMIADEDMGNIINADNIRTIVGISSNSKG